MACHKLNSEITVVSDGNTVSEDVFMLYRTAVIVLIECFDADGDAISCFASECCHSTSDLDLTTILPLFCKVNKVRFKMFSNFQNDLKTAFRNTIKGYLEFYASANLIAIVDFLNKNPMSIAYLLPEKHRPSAANKNNRNPSVQTTQVQHRPVGKRV